MSANSRSGANNITGGTGNDQLNGGSGNDVILGLGGNDRINAGSGNDTMDGGAGNDIVSGDAGDDLGIYVLGENVGSNDVYDGGSGIDTLQLVMTRAEWLSAAVQADIARYLAFLAEVVHPVNGQAKNTNFTFSFGLTVSKFESLGVIVDGVAFDPRDQAVTLVNDVMAAGEDTVSVAVNVLANDSVPDLIANLTNTAPAHGAVTLTRTSGAPGAADTASFVYTPNSAYWQFLAAGQTATDSFTYTVTDADGDTSTATVTVTITGSNDAPTITAAVSSGVVTEDGAVNASGTIDFGDADLRDAHTVSSTAGGTGYLGTFTATVTDNGAGDGAGSISWNFAVDNAATQYLAAGQILTQTYTVTVSDGEGGTVSQPVTVTITGTNDTPTITAADTSGSIREDSASQGGVVGSATLVITEAPGQGVRVIDRADLRIAPNADLGDAGQPSIAVTGTVSAEGEQDRYVITLRAGEIITLDVDFAAGFGSGPQPGGYQDDFGLDSEVLIYDSAGNLLNVNDDAPVTSGGAGSPLSQDSYLRFTATADGQYTIVVRGYATGTPGFYSTGAYTLNVSVDAASNATLTDSGIVAFADVDLSDGHSVTVVSNGSGYLGALTAVVSNPSSGDGAGEVTWTFAVPNPAIQFLAVGQTLTQSYTVRVDDGRGGTVDQAVEVTLTGTNDAPIITSNQANRTLTEGGPTTSTGVMTFGDVDLTDGHIVSVTPVTTGNLGTFVASVSNASTGDGTGAVTWTFQVDPAEIEFLSQNQGRQQRYSVIIADGNGGTTEQLVIITIRGTNDRPVITAAVSTGAVVEDGVTSATGAIAFGDVDLRDNHVVSSSADRPGYLGTFTAGLTNPSFGDGAGSVSWNFAVNNAAIQDLGAGETLTQTYTVTVSDGRGGTVSQPVTVTITGTNDAPRASGDTVSTTEDGSLTLPAADVTANDSDLDGDTLTIVSVDGSASSGTVQLVGGQIVYSPGSAFQTLRAGETGLDRFSYTVTDPSGATATATVEVVINGANDAPTAGDDSAFANAGGSVVINVLANDSDPEGDALTIDSVGAAGNGTVVINADGTVTYTPAAGFSGGDSFSYAVRDASGAVDTATVSLVVGLSDHDTVGGDVFLQGNFMEIGVSRSGSLGTASAAPSNYHPQGRSNISYVVDTDGWTSGAPARAGDFTLPGSPVDTIVLGVNGVSFAQDERSGRRDINTTTTDISTDTLLGARTVGVAGGVQLTQTITLDPGATYYTTTITVTNVSGATVNDVRFMRSFDPDQDQFRYGNFTTVNDVLSNPTAGNDLAVARALGPNSGVSVNLLSFEGDARASNFGFANYNAYVAQAYNSPVDLNGATVDQAITMAFSFGSLAAGATATRVFYTSLNGSSQGNDMLIGGTGGDVLNAGGGNDFVIGLTGNDQLTGGTGNDRFVFTNGSGRDVITDFTAGAGTDDVLEIRGFGFTDLAGIRAVSNQVGADVVINLSATDSVTLRGVQLSNLSADDFLFDAAAPAPAAMAPASEKGGAEVLPAPGEDEFLLLAGDPGEPATLPEDMAADFMPIFEGLRTFDGESDGRSALTLLAHDGAASSGDLVSLGAISSGDDYWL